MRIILVFFSLFTLLFISSCSTTGHEYPYLKDGAKVFETSPAFNPYAKADAYLNEKNGKLYLHISHIFIKHNEVFPEKEIFVKSVALHIAYFNEDEFCYFSSGKKICRAADWKSIPTNTTAEINKTLSKGNTLEINHLNLEFDLSKHNIKPSQKLKLSLSLNVGENASVTMTNISDPEQ